MVRSFAAVMALALAVFAGTNAAFAHGVGYRESDLKPVSLEFSYSTGESMSYMEAKVFSPQDEKIAYQSGRTDEKGRFAFTPDVAGAWRVVVKDEEGHMTEAKVEVTPASLLGQDAAGSAVPSGSTAPGGMELAVRAGLGVSLLLNLAAVVSFVRRRGRRNENAHQ